MLKVEVKEAKVFSRDVTRKRDGKVFHFRVQAGYAHIPGKPYPVEFEIGLGTEQEPYAPGFYTVGSESLYVDRYGQLNLGRLVLEPVKAARAV
jgi:hypothetical protein